MAPFKGIPAGAGCRSACSEIRVKVELQAIPFNKLLVVCRGSMSIKKNESAGVFTILTS